MTSDDEMEWWEDMAEDLGRWISKCLTCLRFSMRPTKQEQQAVKVVGGECWEEVVIDFEGPSCPPDRKGNRYTLTYVCCLCHGVLLEAIPNLTKSEVRRARMESVRNYL